jgi:hypothetical protein
VPVNAHVDVVIYCFEVISLVPQQFAFFNCHLILVSARKSTQFSPALQTRLETISAQNGKYFGLIFFFFKNKPAKLRDLFLITTKETI